MLMLFIERLFVIEFGEFYLRVSFMNLYFLICAFVFLGFRRDDQITRIKLGFATSLSKIILFSGFNWTVDLPSCSSLKYLFQRRDLELSSLPIVEYRILKFNRRLGVPIRINGATLRIARIGKHLFHLVHTLINLRDLFELINNLLVLADEIQVIIIAFCRWFIVILSHTGLKLLM